jgi:hypothetical protein
MNESTFRSLFRKAIGEEIYPAGLSNRVEALINPRGVFRSLPTRPRNPWLVGIGRMGSLAAAFLIVLLLATLVAGVRVWRDRSVFNGSPSVPTVSQVELAQLEARPLILPAVPAGSACPITPNSAVDLGPYNLFTHFGGGPVYGVASAGAGSTTTTNWGAYYDFAYVAEPPVTSAVLIRIHDIQSDKTGVFVGPYGAGRVVGTDTIGGKAVQQHADLVLDASHPPASLPNRAGMWNVQQGWARGFSGCFGIQIDGAGFTEVIVIAGS